jgi:hypothetical protein
MAINRLPQVEAVIFLVDASKSLAFRHTRYLLHRLVAHPRSRGKPFPVLGSKAELLEAVDRDDLMRGLALNKKPVLTHEKGTNHRWCLKRRSANRRLQPYMLIAKSQPVVALSSRDTGGICRTNRP